MGLFDSLGFAQPDPNNPFQQQAPSTTELIFRLAQNLGPLAPYIGGHRTPLGRMLGGTAALAGGVSGTAADLLAQQRLDPIKQKMLMAQAAINQANAPQQGGFAPAPMAPGQGGMAPLMAGTPPDTNSMSFTMPPENPLKGVTAQQLVSASAIPALTPFFDPNKQLTREYLQRQINAPIKLSDTESLLDPTGTRVIRKGEQSPIEKEKERMRLLNQDFSAEVAAGLKTNPELTPGQVANQVFGNNAEKYGELAQSNVLINEGREFRAETRRINAARESQAAQQAQQARQFAESEKQANLRFQRDLDTRAQPGIYADRTTGELRTVTRGEFAADRDKKNPNGGNLKPVNQQEAITHDLLVTAGPIIDRMEELVPKVLAKNKGKQLGTVMSNYAAHKMGFDQDLQDLMSLGTSLSAEQGRALSGSSRVLGSMFNAIKGETVPGMGVTADVAMRQLNTARQEINNRLRSIRGQPLEKITAPTAPPGKENKYSTMSDDEFKALLK
jgi:hypothetical protein